MKSANVHLPTKPGIAALVRLLAPHSGALSHPAIGNYAELPWAEALQAAAFHGVRPALFHRLTEISWRGVEPALLERLRKFQERSAMRKIALATELATLTEALTKENINVLAFKGPVVAAGLYGGLEYREFNDLDILIRSSDRDVAHAVLSGLGYRCELPGEQLTGATAYPERLGQRLYTHASTGTQLDLHWKLAPFGMALPFDERDVWKRVEIVDISGFSIPSLAWDLHALLLGFHGGKERWRLLKWIRDFGMLQRLPNLDWPSILERAQAKNSGRTLLIGALLAKRVADMEIAPELAEAAKKSGAAQAYAKRVSARILAPAAETELSKFADSLRNYETVLGKVRFIGTMATMTTKSDEQQLRLPERLRLLRCITRPFRLLVKAVRLWWT